MSAKRYFVTILPVIFTATLAWSGPAAWANGELSDVGMERPNAVSIELLGRGLVYSVDYDRAISDEITVGIGFSSWSVGAQTSDGTYYAAASVTIIPMYLDYYFSKSGGSRWYATGGLDYISASFSADDFKISGSGLALVGGVGYEYRAQNGFLFRAAPYLLIGGGSVTLWGGVSAGFTF